MALFEKLKEKRWRDRVARELVGNAAWGQFLFGKNWLCPYCGKVAIEDAKGHPELPDLVLEHLKGCPKWKEFEGPQRSAAELSDSIRKTEITQHMRTSQVWRLRDSEGHWYCPYCARATDVVFSSNKVTKETLEAIVRHLEKCFAYDHGDGQAQPLQYVQSVLDSAERIKRLTGTVSQKVSSDPLWQFKNKNHRWACPYCKRLVDSVDMSSEFLTKSVAPREIAKHLVDSCTEYKGGKGKLASAAELEALTSGGKKKAAVVTRPAAQQDSVMFEAIRAELDEVRKVMSESRQVDEQQKELMRSLEKAGKQQRMMLPDLPQLPGFDFEVLYQPMATVSGDFYDFVTVSDKEIGIVMGDVSGHGMEAALVMSMVKKSLKIHGRGVSSAAEALRVTNADIHEDLAQSTFVSIFYGVLNTETKMLRFSRAGHSPLVLFNPAREPKLYALEPKGIAVGIDKGPVFNRTLEEMDLQLASGDMLVQFTDGVVEANNRKKEEFGAERLYAAIQQYGIHEPKYLKHMIDITLKEFRGEVPAEDDVTVMCIRVQ
jgi:serine phosphatase RsbU (regulator of sigma subunit)